jgi:hypothetical protein
MIDQPVCPPDSILSICRNRLCGVWSTKLYVPHMELYLCYNYVLPTCMSHIWNCLCAIWSAILYAHQSESSRWCMIDQAVCPTTGTFWVLYDRPSYMPVSRSSRWCIVGQQFCPIDGIVPVLYDRPTCISCRWTFLGTIWSNIWLLLLYPQTLPCIPVSRWCIIPASVGDVLYPSVGDVLYPSVGDVLSTNLYVLQLELHRCYVISQPVCPANGTVSVLYGKPPCRSDSCICLVSIWMVSLYWRHCIGAMWFVNQYV